MPITDQLAVEFDETRRVIHIAATSPMQISAEEQLEILCETVQQLLTQHGHERVYMIVDITNLGIDPHLNKSYGKSICKIAEQFLYPGGIARYGYQITRVTVELGLAADKEWLGHLFRTRDEAELYIDGLIAARAGRTDAMALSPEDTCGYSAD